MSEPKNHPLTPVRWAQTATLTQIERDCVTAVILKILDAKCKMPPTQQEAMLAIYDTLNQPTSGLSGGLFREEVHALIDQGLNHTQTEGPLRQQLHQLRLTAEAHIEKPVMKAFKARLCRELFEVNT